MRPKPARAAPAAALTAALATALLVTPALAATPIEESCRRAEGGPPLMWYSSADPAQNAMVLKGFAAAYPRIRAQSFRLPSGALSARYSSERESGVVGADIVSVSDPMFMAAARAKGWMIEFPKDDLPNLARLDPRFFDHGAALTGIYVVSISYNPDLVGEPRPKDWPDLLRPAYKGKLAIPDPRNVPSFMAMFRLLQETYGPDFLPRLAAQEPVLVPSVVPGTQQLAAGQFAVLAPNSSAVEAPLIAKGAPVAGVVPAMTTGIEYATMLSAGARSPDAARCLYNFLFTDAGQLGFNGATAVSPLPGVAGTAPMPSGYRSPRIETLAPYEKSILDQLNIR